jgi:hypothetical protein
VLAGRSQAHGFLSLHIDHPDELTPEAVELIRQLRSFGFIVISQSVSLKGGNDDTVLGDFPAVLRISWLRWPRSPGRQAFRCCRRAGSVQLAPSAARSAFRVFAGAFAYGWVA